MAPRAPQMQGPSDRPPKEHAPTSGADKVFVAEKAMRRINIRGELGTGRVVTIFTLHMDGLGTKDETESLKALTHHLQFTVGVSTGTHLLNSEVEALQFPGYQILDGVGECKRRGGV